MGSHLKDESKDGQEQALLGTFRRNLRRPHHQSNISV